MLNTSTVLSSLSAMPKKPLMIALLSCLVISAHADERESLEQLRATTTSLIDLLVQEGLFPAAS